MDREKIAEDIDKVVKAQEAMKASSAAMKRLHEHLPTTVHLTIEDDLGVTHSFSYTLRPSPQTKFSNDQYYRDLAHVIETAGRQAESTVKYCSEEVWKELMGSVLEDSK